MAAGHILPIMTGLDLRPVQARLDWAAAHARRVEDLAREWSATALRATTAPDPDAGETPTYIDITCNDAPYKRSPAQQAALSKKLGARYPLAGYAQITNACVHWKKVPGQLKIRRPAGGGLPRLLLVQSVLDPATPYSEAVKARKKYKNSRLITVKNEGDHALYAGGNPCVDRVVERYLVDGVFPKGNGSCQGTPLPAPVGTDGRARQGQSNPLDVMHELDRLTGRS